jgi:hypothetical protein
VAFFAGLDKFSSKRAKSDLSAYLKSPDLSRLFLKMSPEIAILFERVFGKHHLSLKTAVRSIYFSIGATLGLLLIFALEDPRMFRDWLNFLGSPDLSTASIPFWLAIAIFVDYCNLYKTRIIINYLSKAKFYAAWLVAIFVADLLIGFCVFSALVFLTIVLNPSPNIAFPHKDWLGMAFLIYGGDYSDFIMWLLKDIFSGINNITTVLFYAGMIPSIWLWLYIFSSFIANMISRTSGGIKFLAYFLDFEEHPIQSLGVLAATFLSGYYLLWIAVKRLFLV